MEVKYTCWTLIVRIKSNHELCINQFQWQRADWIPRRNLRAMQYVVSHYDVLFICWSCCHVPTSSSNNTSGSVSVKRIKGIDRTIPGTSAEMERKVESVFNGSDLQAVLALCAIARGRRFVFAITYALHEPRAHWAVINPLRAVCRNSIQSLMRSKRMSSS